MSGTPMERQNYSHERDSLRGDGDGSMHETVNSILHSKSSTSTKISQNPPKSCATGDTSLGPDSNAAREAGGDNQSDIDQQELRDNVGPWYYNANATLPSENHLESLHNILLHRDAKQCEVWKEEVQNLLILAGLFSAIVTAFIIESYQTLQPDPNDQIISLLSLIAAQMSASVANTSTHQNAPPPLSVFVPAPSSIRVNICWFMSLVLSLTVALIGIVTLQWLREHQLYEDGMETMKIFAILNARRDGLKRWYVPQIFAGLPLLLQAAIVLFLVGVVEFLFAIRIEVAIPVSLTVTVPILFLAATTVLPTLQLYAIFLPYFLRLNDDAPAPCPYKSPQALLFRRATVASTIFFNLSARVFSTLFTPFVVIFRIFSRSSKSFYGKSAPFSTDNSLYQTFCDRLCNAAGNWMSMDVHWIAARTSYAVALHTPVTQPHSQLPYHGSDHNVTASIAFYDCITGMKSMMSTSDPRDHPHGRILIRAANQIISMVCSNWHDALGKALQNPRISEALQVHLTAHLRIISPADRKLTEGLVELSKGDMQVLEDTFLTVLLEESFASEFDFHHRLAITRVVAHFNFVSLYLKDNAHKLFQLSNSIGITPSLLPSAQSSISHRREFLEQLNPSWMKYLSFGWTRTLKYMIKDAQKLLFWQAGPFAQNASNLRTKSIVALTEYIILLQVRTDIQDTLRRLHRLLRSKPDPVQDLPYVLVIACAYVNAVANIDPDDVDEFRTLLVKICNICGSLDPALEVRPGGTGRYWPKMETAFNYIRHNHTQRDKQSVPRVPKSLGLSHNLGVTENV